MNIAHLTSVHGRYDTRIFHKMCRSLIATGHSVTLYVADGEGDERLHGIEIVDLGKPTNRLARASLITTRMWRKALRGKHDLYHFHDPELIAGGLVARRLDCCVIYDIHEYYRLHFLRISGLPSGLSRLLASLYGMAERFAIARLDACIVVSPHMLKTLNLRHGVVVANYVRGDEFQPGPRSFAHRPRLICYVGVLSKERCVATMVESLPDTNVTLALAGKWYPPSFRTLITTQPGWSSIKDLGIIDRNQMQSLLAQARAGLIVNDFHGDEEHASSNKLFEYMAAGLPVIASDIQFARDVISRHHCGLLITPPTDPAAIASAITWILDHPEEAERMGRAGRRAIESEYCWDKEANRLLRLYKDLDQRHRNN